MWTQGDREVKVGVYINPPLAFPCAGHGLKSSDQCWEPGIACEFFAMCLDYLNLTHKVVEVSDSLGSYVGNDTWSGLLGMVHNGSIDSIALFTAYTSQRLKYFSYTTPFYDVRYAFVVKRGDLETPSDATRILVNGFATEVWLALLVTLATVLVSWTCTKWAWLNCDGHSKIVQFFKLFMHSCWEKTAYVFQQDRIDMDPNSVSKGTVFMLASMLAVIMINVYQNIIFNQIASTANDAPFRTSSELVKLIERGSLAMLTDSPQISYFDYVNYSNGEHFQQVRQAISKNPLRVVKNSSQAVGLLQEGGYVYVTSYYFALDLVKDDCDLTLVFLDTSTTFWGGFIFNKESKLRPKFDKASSRLRTMLEYIERETAVKYGQSCPGHTLKPATVKNLSGLLILYLAVNVSCVLTLAGEMVIRRAWGQQTTDVIVL